MLACPGFLDIFGRFNDSLAAQRASKPYPATNSRKERLAARTPLWNRDSFVRVEIDADATIVAHPNPSGVANLPNSIVEHAMRPIIAIERVRPFWTTENGLDFMQGHALVDQFAIRFADSIAR
jgi:hypothetical protein